MNKLFSFLFLLSCLLTKAQTKINGITFPDTYIAEKEKLVLNGGGTREKYWMDMYVAGLYLTEKNKDANSIINGNSSMSIRLCIVSRFITSVKIEGMEFKKAVFGIWLGKEPASNDLKEGMLGETN